MVLTHSLLVHVSERIGRASRSQGGWALLQRAIPSYSAAPATGNSSTRSLLE